MIPLYQAKEDELLHKYDRIKTLGKELNQVKEEHGIVIRKA